MNTMDNTTSNESDADKKAREEKEKMDAEHKDKAPDHANSM